MNFLLHFHFARRELAADRLHDVRALGAMLPDLFRMASPRLRPAPAEGPPATGDELRALLDGFDHHHAIDRWFHASRAFAEGERDLKDRFLAARSPKLVLFAHAAWEMCLDGAWLARDDAAAIRALAIAARAARPHVRELAELRGYYAALSESAGADASKPVASIERASFDTRLERIFDALEDGMLYADYASARGIARRVSGIRAAFGFPRATSDDLDRWTGALEPSTARAPAALAALEEERARG